MYKKRDEFGSNFMIFFSFNNGILTTLFVKMMYFSKLKKVKKLTILLTFICSFSTFSLEAKTITINDSLNWLPPQSSSIVSGQIIHYIEFQGCSFLALKQNLPAYIKVIKLDGLNEKVIGAAIENIKYAALSDSELAALGKRKSFLTSDFAINFSTEYSKRFPYADIQLIPLRNHNGIIEKLTSFTLNIKTASAQNPNISKKQNDKQTTNSVLASGTWYKIAITKDGVYKLTYNFLKSIGIDVNSIDPRNIRIYGNGGLQLPEENAAYRIDDLAQNNIYVSGENDGVFNKSDYVLFYGKGPVKKNINMSSGIISHQLNQYSDTAYYYLTTDLGTGNRIANRASATLSPNKTITTYNAFQFYEKDLVNLLQSGSTWLGETFDNVLTYNFKFDFPNIDPSQPVTIKTDVVARSDQNSSFNVSADGHSQNIGISYVNTGDYEATYAIENSNSFSFNTSNPLLNVSISYNKPSSVSEGWLNYIEVNATCDLDYTQGQMSFLNTSSVGTGNISQFELGNANSNLKIWDVTNFLQPVNQNYNLSGSNLSFVVPTDTLKKFIAFTTGDSSDVFFKGEVSNQNLHAINQADLVIVANPKFLTDAKKIGDFHTQHDGMNVVTVTTQQIYNEFSSGLPDPVGIRDFIRMLYNRAPTASQMPKYLLLVGAASYDYKNVIHDNTNYVPTYEGKASPFSPTSTFNTDAFYGLLDQNEGNFFDSSKMIDIGIGRLPVSNNTQLDAIVNKIKNYNTPATMQDWRNKAVFVSDDRDHGGGTAFMSASDGLANIVESRTPIVNINKIYLDAYRQYTTPGGDRYPDVENAINESVQAGSLVINYVGHGGGVGWAHERVLQLSDINNWTNDKNLPLFVTGTCEFSQFDNPSITSAGEYVLFNPSGGGIGLITTTRPTYLTDNHSFNTKLFTNAFTPWHKKPTLGQIFMKIKQEMGGTLGSRKFSLLGDPALTLAYPKYDIHMTAINNNTPGIQDTLRALEKVTVKGFVSDTLGNKLTNFNGTLYPTVYGKISNIATLNNDHIGSPYSFQLRKVQIFRGQASVTNGDFQYSFIVPRDINYAYGTGKFSHYAQNGTVDASGSFSNFIIGGTDTSTATDKTGPTIKLYMNNTSFVNGGITNENPIFLALINDEHGINMTGNGVGHNITAVIDEDTKDPIILNNFYKADLNSYQSGKIDYPLSNLAEGKHTITLKVWDVYDNSSTATIDFYVVKNQQLELQHVLNYPNPFTTKTEFMFETNQAGTHLNIQIQIYTVAGKLVKTIYKNTNSDGFRIHGIYWDGRDDFGDKLARGVYIYKLKVTAGNGTTAHKIEKLVLL